MGKNAADAAWTAQIVHYPYPRPVVIRTDDIHVETIQGPLRAIECYLRANQKTIAKATLEPPGKSTTPQEYIDRVIE